MKPYDAALRDGHYATKQIFCRDRLIAWSHQRRFETGLRLALRFGGAPDGGEAKRGGEFR